MANKILMSLLNPPPPSLKNPAHAPAKMFSFAKSSIEISDNSQTQRVRDLKILPDLKHRLKKKNFFL